MDRTDYLTLYRLFDGITPLPRDCGVLCGKACCRGDENTGMLLFPHEETVLRTVETDGRRYAVCGGRCDRTQRPLSCRIFPLFPFSDEAGRILVTADPRAKKICPLARQAKYAAFSRPFIRAVLETGRILSRDAAGKAFLTELSGEIREIAALNALLGGAG